MENRRQGQTPQRRPPVRPRSYPPQAPQSRTTTPQPRAYPPQPRTYPPPQVTAPRRTPQVKPPQVPQTRKPPATPTARKSPATPTLRKTPQVSQAHKSPAARKAPAATIRKGVLVPNPEPRFRDVLWPDTRDTPAQNRIASLCALLYALIHVFCGVLCVYPLNVLTARMPSVLSALFRALLPGLIGAVLCALSRYPMRLENRAGLSAYRKLLRAVLTLLVGVLLLMWGEWAALRQVVRFVLLFVAGPLASGTGLSVLLLYMDWLYDIEEDEDA